MSRDLRLDHIKSSHAAETGSALIYILVAVALIAALTVSMMEPSNQQAQSQNTTNLVTAIDGQVTSISSTLQDCVLTYPDQDSELTATYSRKISRIRSILRTRITRRSQQILWLPRPMQSVVSVVPAILEVPVPTIRIMCRFIAQIPVNFCHHHLLSSVHGRIITVQTVYSS